jgi:hypothetical protein
VCPRPTAVQPEPPLILSTAPVFSNSQAFPRSLLLTRLKQQHSIMASRSRWLLFLVLAHMALASGQIKLFINKLPDYSSIAACAEFQLSTIVRNMEDGCGDGSKTTSYNCFCHTSSSYFSSLISYKVEKACATDNPDRQRSSAVGLFETYCHMGDSLTSGMPDP